MRALLLTDDDDFESSLPALDLFATGVVCSSLADPTASGPNPDVVVVDARTDLAAGRAACDSLAAVMPSAPVLVVLAAEDLAAVGPDWVIDDVLLTTASAVEVYGRLRLAIAGRRRAGDDELRVGDLTLHPASYSVSIAGRELGLTITEFKLLNYLLQHAGRAFTRNILLREVWGREQRSHRTVDVHVQRLRAKLGTTYGSVVDTVRGVGYMATATPQRRSCPAGAESGGATAEMALAR